VFNLTFFGFHQALRLHRYSSERHQHHSLILSIKYTCCALNMDPQDTINLPFQDLDDSPLFRHRVSQLEQSTVSLTKKANKLIKGAKSYVNGIEANFHGAETFADSLEAFCATGSEPEIGGCDVLARFSHTFHELSSFHELLRTQVELIMCERLSHNWDTMAANVKEAKKKYEKRSSEYDTATFKHLGHSRNMLLAAASSSSSKANTDKSQGELIAARLAAAESRYQLVSSIMQIESRKKYDFLEAVTTATEAHLAFFERGAELMKNLQPYLNAALEEADIEKSESAAQVGAMNDMIETHKKQQLEGLGGSSQRRQSDTTTTGGGVNVFGADGITGTPPRPAGGPMQMNNTIAALAIELESYIRATSTSGGQHITVLKQGYLLKQSSGLRKEWKRRFFVLDSQGMLYYYSNKEKSDKKDEKQPHNTVNLLTSTIKPGAGDEPSSSQLRYCFRVISPAKEYSLQAESEEDAKEWMDIISGVISCLLNRSFAPPPEKPSRPTHSRTSSTSTSTISAAAADQSVSHVSGPLGSAIMSGGNGALSSRSLFQTTATLVGCQDTATSPERQLRPPSSSLGSARRPSSITTTTNLMMEDPPHVDLLRNIPGCHICADCGSPDPDWASLNLGVIVCIECSGVHRQLGVHVSKVRSLTLDVKVWEPSVLSLFQTLGNQFTNQIWEAALAYENKAQQGGESWVWGAGSDSDGDDGGAEIATLSAAVQRMGVGGGGGKDGEGTATIAIATGIVDNIKPLPSAPSHKKKEFIEAKYIGRRFTILPDPTETNQDIINKQLQTMLWESVAEMDIRSAYYAIACGAKLTDKCFHQPAAQLVWESNLRAAGTQDQPISPGNLGDVNPLHAAARAGGLTLVELLLQNGAHIDSRDVFGRTPLMYAVLFDWPEVAKLLLRRGAAGGIRDRMGMSAIQWTQEQERCRRDTELAALLTMNT